MSHQTAYLARNVVNAPEIKARITERSRQRGDSQEIATLLHYSTQTIYNYKSGMRAKAINRDTFESDINQLCHIINS